MMPMMFAPRRCIVGIKLSQATYYLRSQDMVATLLSQMADHSALDVATRLQLAEQLAASQESVLAEEAVEPLTTDV